MGLEVAHQLHIGLGLRVRSRVGVGLEVAHQLPIGLGLRVRTRVGVGLEVVHQLPVGLGFPCATLSRHDYALVARGPFHRHVGLR